MPHALGGYSSPMNARSEALRTVAALSVPRYRMPGVS
jgi:hypothetical protein